MNLLGTVLMGKNDLANAESTLSEALSRMRRSLGEDHDFTINTMSLLGSLHRRREHWHEAELLVSEALERRRRVLPPTHRDTIGTIVLLADVVVHRDAAAAEVLLREAVELGRSSAPTDPRTAGAVCKLGGLVRDAGRFAEAEVMLREAHELFSRRKDAGGAQRVVRELITLYEAWHRAEPGAGHDASVAEWRQQLPVESPTGR